MIEVVNPLTKLMAKYIESKDDARLNIILESFDKKASAINIKSLKMLIEDFNDDKDMSPLNKFLGIKEELAPIDLSVGPMNQDDFVFNVKEVYGDPLDPKSMGNRILDGKLNHFEIASYYRPDALMRKFASLASREYVELDFYPRTNGSGARAPRWEVCILGTHKIVYTNRTNVN